MKNILSFIILTLLFFNFCKANNKIKALWVVRDALKNSDGISDILTTAQKLNCNTLFIQFRALGQKYYPSDSGGSQVEITKHQLIQFIKTAHQQNIQVHAWLNISYIWSGDEKPKDPKHILFKANNSLMQYNKSVNSSNFRAEGYFIEPNDKANLSEIKLIIKELINTYNVDGIHLDYFRFPGYVLPYSLQGRSSFIVHYGLDPLYAIAKSDEFIKERGLKAYTFFVKCYQEFLRNELTSTLEEIQRYIYNINTDIKLSVAVKANPIEARHRFDQDWLTWLDKGLCDFVVPMNYSPERDNFDKNLNWIAQFAPKEKIVIGIATYNIKEKELTARIKSVENDSYSGFALFSYNVIHKNHYLYVNLLKATN